MLTEDLPILNCHFLGLVSWEYPLKANKICISTSNIKTIYSTRTKLQGGQECVQYSTQLSYTVRKVYKCTALPIWDIHLHTQHTQHTPAQHQSLSHHPPSLFCSIIIVEAWGPTAHIYGRRKDGRPEEGAEKDTRRVERGGGWYGLSVQQICR